MGSGIGTEPEEFRTGGYVEMGGGAGQGRWAWGGILEVRIESKEMTKQRTSQKRTEIKLDGQEASLGREVRIKLWQDLSATQKDLDFIPKEMGTRFLYRGETRST